ncbi:MAG: hypothetical protein C5B59_20620 [Bacteroidetes bacterium]|nr:MAG: hypothetical protein C5B59_20620 [Bacteroidota bacterium]
MQTTGISSTFVSWVSKQFGRNTEYQYSRNATANKTNSKEEAGVLFLNRSKRVIGEYRISSGGITGTVMDIRIILGIALKCLGCDIIVAHSLQLMLLK